MPDTPYEVLSKRAQTCISRLPVVILGSGASTAEGIPGMGELREHLLTVALPVGSNVAEQAHWDAFLAKLGSTDLESALQDVNLPPHLDDHVVLETWKYLQPYDIAVFDRMLNRQTPGALTRLFQHLLRSTNKSIDVVTPNYDRLAEYAADMGDLYHETGFRYGHMRNRIVDGRQEIHINGARQSCVNVWKVHGSFEWFRDSSKIVRALPISHPRPSDWTPAIVTPGIQKYRRTYDEPFVSIKTASDRAMSTAPSFFCVGFGFNDDHIQTKLRERCRAHRVPLVLITHTITSTAKSILGGLHCEEYLAVEKAEGACRIYCPEFPTGAEVSEGEFWQLENFLTLVTT